MWSIKIWGSATLILISDRQYLLSFTHMNNNKGSFPQKQIGWQNIISLKLHISRFWPLNITKSNFVEGFQINGSNCLFGGK